MIAAAQLGLGNRRSAPRRRRTWTTRRVQGPSGLNNKCAVRGSNFTPSTSPKQPSFILLPSADCFYIYFFYHEITSSSSHCLKLIPPQANEAWLISPPFSFFLSTHSFGQIATSPNYTGLSRWMLPYRNRTHPSKNKHWYDIKITRSWEWKKSCAGIQCSTLTSM